MRLHYLFVLALFALGGATVARADGVPGHFIINLNDNCSVDPSNPDCSNVNGTGGWGANNSFSDTVNTGDSTSGFQNNFTCSDDRQWFWWWWQNHNQNDCDPDPSIKWGTGGASGAFPTTFSADGSGGGILDFYNGSGTTIHDVFITTNLVAGVTYTCDGGGVFSFCGFEALDNGKELGILFSGGDIPSVPEPADGIIVLAGFAAIAVGHRLRSRQSAA